MIDLQFGKIPPQAVDIEEAVLGALMLSSSKRDEIIPILKSEIFYKDANQIIFTTIQELYNEGTPIDTLTVSNKLRNKGELEAVGGVFYLTQLTAPVASISNIEVHARIITQKFILREIIRYAGGFCSDAFDETVDVFDLIAQIENFTTNLNQYIIGRDYETNYAKLVEDTYQEIIKKSELGFTGIDTGSAKLNSITGGWQNTDLILLCARPGIGKSTRMVSFMKAAALSGKKSALFTLEMSSRQIIKKQLSEQSGVYGDKILTSNLTDYDKPKLFTAKEELKRLPIYINEKSAVTPNYIKAVCKERKKKYGLDLIFIDYIQLEKPNTMQKGRNREQEISDISASLKNIGKELNVPVIALSQLNREVDKRADKRPILSDLRESGSLEQDADIVLGQYRPSKYHKFSSDADYKDRGDMTEEIYKRVSELHILKHRNGKAEVYFEEMFYGELSRYDTGERQEPITEKTDERF